MLQLVKNLPEKYMHLILEDDETPHGGVSFAGETLRDFIAEAGLSGETSLAFLHDSLVRCGIKSPFRTVQVSVAVTQTLGYAFVTTDEMIKELQENRICLDDMVDDDHSLDALMAECQRECEENSQYSYSINPLDDPENMIAENNAYMPGF